MDLDPIPDLELEESVPAIFEPLCAVFRRRLKADGQKYTPERARVLDAVLRMDGAFEAEQLVEDLRDSGYRVSKATIYRTIKLMQDAGIVQRVLGGDVALPVQEHRRVIKPRAAKSVGSDDNWTKTSGANDLRS